MDLKGSGAAAPAANMAACRCVCVLGCVLAWAGPGGAWFPGVRLSGTWAAPESPEKAGGKLQRPRLFAESANRFHSKWLRPAEEPLSWRFPEAPKAPPTRPPTRLTVQQPEPSQVVAVRCGGSRVQVEVKQDLLGTGRLIHPDHVTLGGCGPAHIDHEAHVLVFESELHECGSKLQVTDGGFLYSFQLLYDPPTLGPSPIMRTQRAVIDVSCHYVS